MQLAQQHSTIRISLLSCNRTHARWAAVAFVPIRSQSVSDLMFVSDRLQFTCLPQRPRVLDLAQLTINLYRTSHG